MIPFITLFVELDGEAIEARFWFPAKTGTGLVIVLRLTPTEFLGEMINGGFLLLKILPVLFLLRFSTYAGVYSFVLYEEIAVLDAAPTPLN